MAYDGSLIKFGSLYQHEIPTAYILYESYEPVISALDTDAKRNANNGTLVRNVIAKKGHVKVTIRSLPEPAVTSLMTELKNATYTGGGQSANEGALQVKFWVPKLGDYYEAVCYIPDITIKIKHIEENRNPQTHALISSKILYESFDLEFIEY